MPAPPPGRPAEIDSGPRVPAAEPVNRASAAMPMEESSSTLRAVAVVGPATGWRGTTRPTFTPPLTPTEPSPEASAEKIVLSLPMSSRSGAVVV